MRVGWRRVVVAVLMALFTGVAGLAPVVAAADTSVTFSVDAQALTISAPVSVVFSGHAAPGGVLTGQLGEVTVTDKRAAVDANWTVTVTTSVFVTGAATAEESIGKGSVGYVSGPATGTTGKGVFTPGQLSVDQAEPLSAARVAFALTGGSGDNTAVWDPTLVIAVPAAAVAGAYTGVITHSVA